MYIDSITFWTTILSGIIIGLVVGGILGRIGFVTWKRQHLYTKKLDTYTSFVHLLYTFCTRLSKIYENKESDKATEQIIKASEDFKSLFKERNIFLFYFGNKYTKPIQELIDLYNELIDKNINMTNEEFDNYISDRLLVFHNIKFK
jgi:hypothetical protein